MGDYPFTTLEPNLGECYGFIISDIPGLIEGAAEGKGLGHKFLRHVRRTKILVHLISLENEDPIETYKIVRQELKAFDPELLNKKRSSCSLRRTLLKTPRTLKNTQKMKKIAPVVFAISLYDDAAIKGLQDAILKEAAAQKNS